MKQTFYSNGKLLLTGEYVVLDGALALTIPTRMGQSLSVESTEKAYILWESRDHRNNLWFTTRFHTDTLIPIVATSEEKKDPKAEQLTLILQKARQLNPEFLTGNRGYAVRTQLDFPRDWGLGSSSTLLNNVAQWASVDAYKLLDESFGGSGYDIAAAQNNLPVRYRRGENHPVVQPIRLSWDFTDRLFFVHLNRKQDSKEGIARYRAISATSHVDVAAISKLTEQIIECDSLDAFTALVETHEHLIAAIVDLVPVKERLFPDYPGAIKSLGAWGGDFVLATGGASEQSYFRTKGYETLIPFAEMIK